MRFWAVIIALSILAGAGGYIIHKIRQADELKIENEILKQEKEEIKDEVKRFANRPKSNDDIVDSLCKWGIERAKAEDYPKSRIPVFCREGI